MSELKKEIEKLKQDLVKCYDKLNNENYIAKAPAEVVAKERARVAEMTAALMSLEEKLGQLEN